MSVGDQLGLEENSDLLDQARQRWDQWVAADDRLAVVERFEDLRPWLRKASPAAADEVLLALAMLAAPDGGDDVAAAGALAKALLPGACLLASRLTATLSRRDTSWCASARIDELVAAQLWMEIRTFPWRRLNKVAANILMNTRAGVLRECDDFTQIERVDRTWANTFPLEALVRGDDEDGVLHTLRARICADAEPDTSPLEELLDVLAWACENDVISDDDRLLLLCLVDEASRNDTRRTGRGNGGLTANEVSIKVAPRVGVSEATVRRRASRSMRALAEAVPSGFRA